MIVDLDAARAARAEARQEAPVVLLGGRAYQLVPELPLEFVEQLEQGNFRLAVGLLLADENDFEPFLANGPTINDIKEIARGYGADLGEASASSGSSAPTGKPSRPTSKRTTASTSAKPAGGRRR